MQQNKNNKRTFSALERQPSTQSVYSDSYSHDAEVRFLLPPPAPACRAHLAAHGEPHAPSWLSSGFVPLYKPARPLSPRAGDRVESALRGRLAGVH